MFENRLPNIKYFNNTEIKSLINETAILLLSLLSIFFIFSCDEVAPHIEDKNLITLSGTVLDSTSNEPINGTSITINERITFSDTLGKFSFDNLEVGTYQLIIDHKNYISKTIEIKLDSNTSINIRLERKVVSLSGTVIDSVSNQPIDSVLVTLNEDTKLTDSQGKFNFTNLLPGNYLINFEHSEYYKKTLDINLQSDSLMLVDLKKIELVDYFPLYIGKTWTYDYEERTIGYHDKGKLEWIVDSISESKSGKLSYHIKSTLNNQINEFIMTEENNEVSFRFHQYDIARFDRFLRDDNPQIVVVDSTIGHPTWPLYERILKIERVVGIKFYHFRMSVGHQSMNYRIELIE